MFLITNSHETNIILRKRVLQLSGKMKSVYDTAGAAKENLLAIDQSQDWAEVVQLKT